MSTLHPTHTRAPVIFIHYGNSSYLKYTLAQAVLARPETPVYLIGDDSNRCYHFVHHVMHHEYTNAAFRFAAHYLHMNGNHPSFELFCFQRWFILRDFMLLHRLEKAVYLDSDVLLYDNLDEDWQCIGETPLALNNIAPPAFINDICMLDFYCQLLERAYTNPEELHKLKRLYADMQDRGVIGGICDMTFWEMLKKQCPRDIKDIEDLLPELVSHDCSIEHPETRQGNPASGDNGKQPAHVMMQNGIKQIVWKDGLPHGRRRDGRLHRFKSLHMHGLGKDSVGPLFHAGIDQLAPANTGTAC